MAGSGGWRHGEDKAVWGSGKECGELDSVVWKGRGDWARCDRPGFFVGRWGHWRSEAMEEDDPEPHVSVSLAACSCRWKLEMAGNIHVHKECS
jgi:hypothetical protein